MPNSSAAPHAPSPQRLIFREVLPGDKLKFKAESSDAGSGGGARDFRFRPHSRFKDVFAVVFPNRESVIRRRGGVPVNLEVWTTLASVHGSTNSHPHKLTYEPPTDAREDEGRLVRLHELGLNVPQNEGRVLLLLADLPSSVVVAFATELQLKHGVWHGQIDAFLQRAFYSKRESRGARQGYVDFTSNVSFLK